MKQKYSNQILRIDGKNCFVEFLNNAFSIGKLQMNFVEYDDKTNKQTKKITLYLDIDRALALCESILSGLFDKDTEEAKKKPGYNSYTSLFVDMGGVSVDKVEKKFEAIKEQYPFLTKGQALSRQLKIQAGMKLPWIIRAEAGVGQQLDTGIISPSGKPQMYINIPLTNEQLRGMAAIVKAHYMAYLNQFYVKFGDDMFDNKVNLFHAD